MYVIQRNVTLDSNKRISYTSNKNQAYINDKEKIENFFNNCLSPAQREKHEIIFFDEPPKLKVTNRAKCEISEAIDNILRFSDEDFDSYKEALIKQLTEVDNEQQDLLHYIEFNSLDVFKGYKAYKMLHECRCRRREIKNKLLEFDIFKSATWDDVKDYKTVSRINGFDERSYAPRVLTELFEVK